MDFVHGRLVLVIQHLQSNYREYDHFLNFMLSMGTPHHIFIVYFPVWFYLNHSVATKTIWSAVVGDWFSPIPKW